MSSPIVKNGSGLMFLSMGVLALLLITYFTVNAKTNLNPNVGAHRQTSAVGVLRKDTNHKRVCNLVAKASYVLEDKLDSSKCIPVVANPSQADENLNQLVEISGDSASGQYFAVKFRKFSPSPDVWPVFDPKPTGSGKPGMTPRPSALPRSSMLPIKTYPPHTINLD